MKFLSLFSGIGGFDLGLERAGMECVGQVEIDPYCLSQLERHWPHVRRWTDVRSVYSERSGAWLRRAIQPDSPDTPSASAERIIEHSASGVDLICGGFPCQDVSVAGKRAGLDGARSGLWFEFHRIVSELRPKYVLVENVPGLLSSNSGRDFAIILNGLGELGYGVSWAVLDSRYFGVAQRRRRVFIVAGPPDGRAEAVLAIAEGCGGHPETSRAAGEDVANPLGASATSFGGQRYDLAHETYVPDVRPALRERDYKGTPQDVEEPAFIAVRTAQTSANGHGIAEDVAHTIDGANGQAVAGASVRRLTPTECERLQGFPDGWTHGADGPRYRALGNAVTVPVIEYLGRRIMAIDSARMPD